MKKSLPKKTFFIKFWSGRRDSNSRHSPWQGDALPLSHSRMFVCCLQFVYVDTLFRRRQGECKPICLDNITNCFTIVNKFLSIFKVSTLNKTFFINIYISNKEFGK